MLVSPPPWPDVAFPAARIRSAAGALPVAGALPAAPVVPVLPVVAGWLARAVCPDWLGTAGERTWLPCAGRMRSGISEYTISDSRATTARATTEASTLPRGVVGELALYLSENALLIHGERHGATSA